MNPHQVHTCFRMSENSSVCVYKDFNVSRGSMSLELVSVGAEVRKVKKKNKRSEFTRPLQPVPPLR